MIHSAAGCPSRCTTALALLMCITVRAALLPHAGHPAAATAPSRAPATLRFPAPVAQFGFKIQKSERLLIREAWERADAYRPGKPNWFTTQKKDLVELHNQLQPEIEALPSLPPPTNATSLLGSLLRVLTTGDLALTLCSKEAPVLTELRDWLVAELPMPEAVLGLPEEQGRVLAALAAALDARKMLDLGTFTGYSSIAMALATADDAKVVCCEPDARSASSARDWWMKAGVASKMEMNECKAEDLLDKLLAESDGEPSFDMVFVDVGDRTAYESIHEQLMKLVRVGGVVVYYDTLWCADNILQHEPYPSMRRFNEMLARDPRVLASLVPLSYGITICVKTLQVDGPKLKASLTAKEKGDSGPFLELLRARRDELEAQLSALDIGALETLTENAEAAPTSEPALVPRAAPSAEKPAGLTVAPSIPEQSHDAPDSAAEEAALSPAVVEPQVAVTAPGTHTESVAADSPSAQVAPAAEPVAARLETPAPGPVAAAPASAPAPTPASTQPPTSASAPASETQIVSANASPSAPEPSPPSPPSPPSQSSGSSASTWTPFGSGFGSSSKSETDAADSTSTPDKKWYF
mmetsp:Transcript_15947/g.21713  ORF Transcript_15947/g.21713 Transcript_15947/m.21713 type:complete len:582 (-) Transcript_15947:554-2299(-)